MDNRLNKWWEFPKWSNEYEQGVNQYIERSFAIKSQENQICCPCDSCHYRYWNYENVVRDHLVCKGFVLRMDKLLELGINFEKEKMKFDKEQLVMNDLNNDVTELLHDTQDVFRNGPNDEAKSFFKLVEEGQEELYLGCKKNSKLYFMIRLFIYKCDNRLTNVAFAGLLELFREVLPDATKIPASFNEAKRVLKVLGLDYTKINSCPNDCMLYWDEHANETSCHVCETSRWKSNDKDNDKLQENETTHRIPRKILRYFPIKKRLQRLYMCEETARYMTWHANGRETTKILQHPSDGQDWKDFDCEFK